MELFYDNDADALDIQLLEGADVVRTVTVDAGTLVDLDERGRLVSIEVIRPARRWPLDTILAQWAVEDEVAAMLRALWREPNSYPFAEQGQRSAASSEAQVIVPA